MAPVAPAKPKKIKIDKVSLQNWNLEIFDFETTKIFWTRKYSNINVLTDYFISEKYLEDFSEDVVEHHLVKEWCRLLKGIWEENCTIAPNSFYKIVSILAHRDGLSFSGYQQNDLQEFLTFIIDTMHKALKQDVIINIIGDVKNDIDNLAVNAMKTWKNFFKNDYSIFTELFYGQYITQIKCSNNNCNYISYIYDPFC